MPPSTVFTFLSFISATCAAITSPGNTASAALLERLGLRFERMVQVRDDEDAIRLFAWNAPAHEPGVDSPGASPQTSTSSTSGV